MSMCDVFVTDTPAQAARGDSNDGPLSCEGGVMGSEEGAAIALSVSCTRL